MCFTCPCVFHLSLCVSLVLVCFTCPCVFHLSLCVSLCCSAQRNIPLLLMIPSTLTIIQATDLFSGHICVCTPMCGCWLVQYLLTQHSVLGPQSVYTTLAYFHYLLKYVYYVPVCVCCYSISAVSATLRLASTCNLFVCSGNKRRQLHLRTLGNLLFYCIRTYTRGCLFTAYVRTPEVVYLLHTYVHQRLFIYCIRTYTRGCLFTAYVRTPEVVYLLHTYVHQRLFIGNSQAVSF